jgi:hypothetical protein
MLTCIRRLGACTLIGASHEPGMRVCVSICSRVFMHMCICVCICMFILMCTCKYAFSQMFVKIELDLP